MRQGTAREAKEAIIRSFGGENSFCCVVYTENLMESGEVLDLGETRQVAARTARVIRFETPASGERGAVGAHKSTKKTLLFQPS